MSDFHLLFSKTYNKERLEFNGKPKLSILGCNFNETEIIGDFDEITIMKSNGSLCFGDKKCKLSVFDSDIKLKVMTYDKFSANNMDNLNIDVELNEITLSMCKNVCLNVNTEYLKINGTVDNITINSDKLKHLTLRASRIKINTSNKITINILDVLTFMKKETIKDIRYLLSEGHKIQICGEDISEKDLLM